MPPVSAIGSVPRPSAPQINETTTSSPTPARPAADAFEPSPRVRPPPARTDADIPIRPSSAAAVPFEVVEDSEMARPATYTVQSGDNLGGIARRFDTTVPKIMEINPEITDPNLIRVGQVIRLPQSAPSIAPASDFASLHRRVRGEIGDPIAAALQEDNGNLKQ